MGTVSSNNLLLHILTNISLKKCLYKVADQLEVRLEDSHLFNTQRVTLSPPPPSRPAKFKDHLVQILVQCQDSSHRAMLPTTPVCFRYTGHRYRQLTLGLMGSNNSVKDLTVLPRCQTQCHPCSTRVFTPTQCSIQAPLDSPPELLEGWVTPQTRRQCSHLGPGGRITG